MNELARQVLNLLSALKQDSDKFSGTLSVLTKHVTNAKNQVDLVNEHFRTLASKVERAQSMQIEEKKVASELQAPKIDF